MAISYEDALEKVHAVAIQYANSQGGSIHSVPLLDSLGRIAANDHLSPTVTPPHDTSAMDGYAIASDVLIEASLGNPVSFVIKGTIAAGDEPIQLTNELEDGCYPCVEIMTGARFPHSLSARPFDACVKIEDTIALGSSTTGVESKPRTKISVTRPLPLNANRRFAGADMRRGDLIIKMGEAVRPRHIMALASVGIAEINVYRKLRVDVWSTGNELSEGPHNNRSESQIFNSNGPYLVSALQEYGAIAEYKGILKDDASCLRTALNSTRNRSCDLVLTTGAVSKGKFDFIVPALEEMSAKIHFHGVAIRPGHPVLFASIKTNESDIPLFGLPGNPIATAACFRFLVLPFFMQASGIPLQQPEKARLRRPLHGLDGNKLSPSHLDCFRHGILETDLSGQKFVELSTNQSPAIISHFAESNCWIHLPKQGPDPKEDNMVYYYAHDISG